MNIMDRTAILLVCFAAVICRAVKILDGRELDRIAPLSGVRQDGVQQGPGAWMGAQRHPNDPLYQTSEGVAEFQDSVEVPSYDDGIAHGSDVLDSTGSDDDTGEGDDGEEYECPICYLRMEEAKQIRLEYIKRTILDRLGMEHPPNVSANIALPKNAEWYRMMSEFVEGTNTNSAYQNDQPQSPLERNEMPSVRLEKMILFPKNPPVHWNLNQNTSYAFTFSEKMYNYDVGDASMQIHILGKQIEEPSSAYYVLVKQVFNPPTGSLTPKIKTIVRKKVHLRPPKGQWVALNLTELVQEWFDTPEEHNVIQLSLVDVNNNPHDELLDTNTDSTYRKRSFLLTDVIERRHSRLRRMAEDTLTCSEGDRVRSCCRYAMMVDFEEMEWDWVISPRSYESNICRGECPRMHLTNGGYQHIRSAIDRSSLCCTPHRMRDLNLLFLDPSENIISMMLPDMVVESCHCA